MQTVAIQDGVISGVLEYVTGYYGFSDVASEQEGNYLALHVSSDGNAVLKVKLVGSDNDGVTLDEDGIVVLKVTNANQAVRVTGTQGDVTITKVYQLSGLILRSA